MSTHPIPKKVCLNEIRFDSKLSPGARLLLAEFIQWNEERGDFPFNSKELASLYHVSQFTIRKWLVELVKNNFVYLYIDMSDGTQQKYIKVMPEN